MAGSKVDASLALPGCGAMRHLTRGLFYVTTTSLPSPAGLLTTQPSIDLHGEVTSPRQLLSALWRARQLLVILARKDFHVRYRRASLGVLWALALPLLQSLVMAIVFSRIGHFRAPGQTSYAAMVLTGMVAWTFFSLSIPAGSTAIVDGTELSSKVYFPRALLPLSQVATASYAFVVTLLIVLALCPLLHVSLGLVTLLVIPASLLLLALICGFVLVGSALHVYFRDVRYIISAAMLLWLYVTPILYAPSSAPKSLRTVIDINPLSGVVDLFRTATIGHMGNLAVPLLSTSVWTVALLGIGLALHCRFNRTFADLL